MDSSTNLPLRTRLLIWMTRIAWVVMTALVSVAGSLAAFFFFGKDQLYAALAVAGLTYAFVVVNIIVIVGVRIFIVNR